MKNKEKTNSAIRIANCEMSTTPISAEDAACRACSSKGRCLSINPELASIIERTNYSNGKYHFKSEDWKLLHEKYPDVFDLTGK